jgi:hypothetical protein
MTISITSAVTAPLAGNGATTAFPFSFKAFTAAEIEVWQSVGGADPTLVSPGAYTVTLNTGEGGAVTFAVAPATGTAITIESNPSFAQPISFTNSGSFLPETHDQANDRAAIRDIYLNSLMDRALKTPVGETASALPGEADRAGNYLAFDADGNAIAGESVDAITQALADISQNTTDISTVTDRANRAIVVPSGSVDPLPDAATRGGKFMQWAATGLSVLMLSASSLVIAIAPQLQAYIGGITKGDPGGNAMAIGAFEAAGTLNIPVGTDAVRTSGYYAVSPGKGIADYAYDATVDAAYVTANPRTSFRTANGRGFKLTGARVNPLQTGAVGDNVADDNPAIVAAVNSGIAVEIPKPYTFRTTGGIVLPDGAKIFGSGGTINFDASVTAWAFCPGADGTAVNVSNIWIEGVHLKSSSDVGFMHFVRLSNTGTIDGFRFNSNTVDYTAVPSNSSDRWVITGSGKGGTRTNFQTNFNEVNGPMQLIATAIGGHLVQHWEILCNQLRNCRSNAIAIVSLGAVSAGNLNTGEDITVGWNDISADTYTATGIFVGIDGVTTDKCVALRRIELIGNTINIVAAGKGQPDIIIKLGNNCANLGGFDSVADVITLDGNKCYGGIQVNQDLPTPTTGASGTSQATNFLLKNGRFLGGDISLAYLADGAGLMNNRSFGSPLRLGNSNGRIESQNNRWRSFNPVDGNAQFAFVSSNDTFTGIPTGTDRVVIFNANAGKVQTGIFNNPTIDSYTTGQAYATISTQGAGNPTVTVRDLKTSTTWAVSGGRYERQTGTITDMTGGEVFSTSVDPPSLAPGASSAEFTITNVFGAQLGDFVERISFGIDTKGIEIPARVSAANTITFYFHNPAGNPNGTVDLGSGAVRASYRSRLA